MSRLRPGRLAAAVLAILLLLGAAGSDFVVAGFWATHPMLTAIVSALAVVVLSVTVIEVVLGRRAERRWRFLAQSALIELGEAAHTTWSSLADGLQLEGASPGRGSLAGSVAPRAADRPPGRKRDRGPRDPRSVGGRSDRVGVVCRD